MLSVKTHTLDVAIFCSGQSSCEMYREANQKELPASASLPLFRSSANPKGIPTLGIPDFLTSKKSEVNLMSIITFYHHQGPGWIQS